jgi:Predicted membrane protein
MDSVLRAAGVYLFLLVVFRAFGKRSLSQITTFDFVMLLIVAETTQQALLGEDFSLTNCFLLICTLLVLDRVLSFFKMRSSWFESVSEGRPLIIIKDGKPLDDRLEKSGVEVEDVLAAARELQGLERLEQIKFAVLERSGQITIIPKGPN